MDLRHCLFYILLIPFLCWLNVGPAYCDVEPPIEENLYYNSFIAARMKHLTAIKNLQDMSNAVKRHKLILDMLKTIFKVLDETRKVPAIRIAVSIGISKTDPLLQDVFQYLENTAFLCDFLVFFPDVTVKLLKNNLLWRIMIIDSLQDAMSSTVKFVDNNTLNQFKKANEILSQETISEEDQLPLPRKPKETKKRRRKPRLTLNEL